MNNEKNKMPKYPQSYWLEAKQLQYQSLDGNTKTDVVIIGSGITGITSAYLLAKEGLKVILLDAGEVLAGTTGHTTAKVTAQHGLIYDELIEHFGIEQARLYYEAQADAIKMIEKEAANINCDFSNESSFIYATNDQYSEKLTFEYDAYKRLGITGQLKESIPFSIPTTGVLEMNNQAQFHPVKYLEGLLQRFIDLGGTVYEHTTVVDIEEGKQPVVITNKGHRILCNYVVMASHSPFLKWKGLYFSRLLPERSYVIAIESDDDFEGNMYYCANNPVRSIRATTSEETGKKLILIGGEGHKTGKGINTYQHYEALQAFSNEVFGEKPIAFRWSAQDLTSLDKIPYIGPITSDENNIFVATGYRKWGMTNGTAAGILLKDLITEQHTPYQELFNPSRFHANPSIKNFITYNADVAGQLIKGKLEPEFKHPEDLANNEGGLVKVDGKRRGCYRDDDGQLHIVDTTCTHLGCETEWNAGERTWDCPCHGSRFSYDGEVIEGPATEPLEKMD
ncbi:FAD-dependent oxidoreductase [Cytobacillus kochii]|uniref:FAD-dependent oxidoreductase n=1 Tax=Cytobacillus kochii TaxID=859143 RepID=UPI0025A27DB6|nr:FAD-dependent oxidoreductase [Cytobacillus kochii]MDM5206633.1 FAD-dependent oxidoreductase [Cytobacillus kochii]